MRRDRDGARALEQRVEARDEARPHLVELLVGDRRRLDVDPLAEPDARLERGERLDVRERPSKRRLEDDPDAVVPVRAQRPVELEGRIGGARVLHVEPHERPARPGVRDEPADE